MEEGEAEREPGWDCDTPPGPRDRGLPDLSGVPDGSPPPGASLGFRVRAETKWRSGWGLTKIYNTQSQIMEGLKSN